MSSGAGSLGPSPALRSHLDGFDVALFDVISIAFFLCLFDDSKLTTTFTFFFAHQSQLNIANPATGCQKKIEITDENKLRVFYDKRISAEVEADSLGDEWKGYIFKIMGGNDKQGFGMKQGVLTNQRVFLLQVRGTQGFKGHGRRKGERRRKACRGCIVSQDISVLNVVIVKQGDADVPGLTDTEVPRMRGPKRASKIRKLFALSKEDSVFPYVNSMRREFESATGKKKSKAQKVQRVVTPLTLQRKRARAAVKKAKIAKSKAEAGEYHKLLQMRIKEQRERRSESIAKRRASSLAKKAAAKTKESESL